MSGTRTPGEALVSPPIAAAIGVAFRTGLPPKASPLAYLGIDTHGAVYLLRWLSQKNCFGALGWRANSPRPWPELVLLRDGEDHSILGHVEATQDAGAPRSHPAARRMAPDMTEVTSRTYWIAAESIEGARRLAGAVDAGRLPPRPHYASEDAANAHAAQCNTLLRHPVRVYAVLIDVRHDAPRPVPSFADHVGEIAAALAIVCGGAWAVAWGTLL